MTGTNGKSSIADFYFQILKLNSKKSKKLLKWKTKLTLIKTLDYTIDWYREYYKNPKKIYQYSLDQLQIYFNSK